MSVAPQGSTKEAIAEGYVSTVIGLYRRLSGLANLDPAPEVNAIFGRLVTVCKETPDEIITNKVLPTIFHALFVMTIFRIAAYYYFLSGSYRSTHYRDHPPSQTIMLRRGVLARGALGKKNSDTPI